MVSDTPTPGRCNAKVTDKIGLDVEIDDDVVITDQEFDVVRLEDADGVTIDAPPNYEDVREYLWNDYSVSMIAAPAMGDISVGDTITVVDEPPTADVVQSNTVDVDSDTHVWLDIAEYVTNVTNRTKEVQGFCERYKMEDSNNCYVHQGGGSPEGNTNAMTHGLHAQRTNYYNSLDADEKKFIEAMVDSWLDMAPFDRSNVAMVNELYRAGIDQLRLWGGVEEFLEDGERTGLVTEQNIFDGEEVHEIEEEHPANLPYSRLDRDVVNKLKTMGIYDSPEAQQADATESLAQKLSGLGSGE